MKIENYSKGMGVVSHSVLLPYYEFINDNYLGFVSLR